VKEKKGNVRNSFNHRDYNEKDVFSRLRAPLCLLELVKKIINFCKKTRPVPFRLQGARRKKLKFCLNIPFLREAAEKRA